jgi:hypothetical protein
VTHRSAPVAPRDPSVPYFAPDRAVPGQRVARVVSNGRCCNELVIVTYDGDNNRLPTLDAVARADGQYVIVQSRTGGQTAVAFDETAHAGWKRFGVHVCKAK